MKTFNLSIILLLITIGLSSCHKAKPSPTSDANGLPFATQTGANTFGCLIDGVPFVVTGHYGWLRGFGVEFYLGLDSTFEITVKSSDLVSSLILNCKADNLIPNTFNANKYITPSWSCLTTNGSVIPSSGGYYQANESLPAKITITKFTGDRVSGGNVNDGAFVSGTFEFEMQNNAGKIVKITEGRFDIARK